MCYKEFSFFSQTLPALHGHDNICEPLYTGKKALVEKMLYEFTYQCSSETEGKIVQSNSNFIIIFQGKRGLKLKDKFLVEEKNLVY